MSKTYKDLENAKSYLSNNSEKKYFPMVLYSYKKHIPQKRTKLSGKTNSMVICKF